MFKFLKKPFVKFFLKQAAKMLAKEIELLPEPGRSILEAGATQPFSKVVDKAAELLGPAVIGKVPVYIAIRNGLDRIDGTTDYGVYFMNKFIEELQKEG